MPRDEKQLTHEKALETIKAIARKIRAAKTVDESIRIMCVESLPPARAAAKAGASADEILDVFEQILDPSKLTENVKANTGHA